MARESRTRRKLFSVDRLISPRPPPTSSPPVEGEKASPVVMFIVIESTEQPSYRTGRQLEEPGSD